VSPWCCGARCSAGVAWGIANVVQTIPSLALFGFLIPVRGSAGVGASTAIVALALYALRPILRNTATGIEEVDAAVIESARGMGSDSAAALCAGGTAVSRARFAWRAIRVATVLWIGVTTIAAAIGAGGLGVFIFRGVFDGQQFSDSRRRNPCRVAWRSGRLCSWDPAMENGKKSEPSPAFASRIPFVFFERRAPCWLPSRCCWPRGAARNAAIRLLSAQKISPKQIVLAELFAQQIEAQFDSACRAARESRRHAALPSSARCRENRSLSRIYGHGSHRGA